ncbi:RNA polymerase subunit sigma-24 [Kineosporia sp. NBRC 101677]|uniref:RNA polymerase sigma factor n=1 Tax=Kineosporia sp. NBRC 101677 TaxID=3032197 RepID=UPI0024A2244C|nr:sigma-70 family RNA polymerase sigma factor [Kineosporia sp. NBRC 101677]GLY14022.1 RNA polymerase subunit sigma-24 [Kineosporia sp. NBRC 101677]
MVAGLVRALNDVQLAEDAFQEASVRALRSWPEAGVPDNPRAWLTVTARRCALDVVRRESRRDEREAEAMRLQRLFQAEPADQEIPDDLLRLVFTCCHPALSVPAQVALSLRTLCGLSTAEVGRALLVPEATAAKRLTRARQKIARAGIPFRIPATHELPARVEGVAACVYLLFNEGYSATAGEDPIRPALADEAIRLGRLLHRLLPDEPALTGLLSLMLLQDSRRPARMRDGELVLLPDQDRSRWRADLIREGVALLGRGLAQTPNRPEPYVVQAAIATCHAIAPSAEQTDWAAIVSWYDVLLTVCDTPVVRLNRSVGVAELNGPASALAEIDELTGLSDYALWHGTRALLLDRLGRPVEAEAARARALELDVNAAIRRRLQRS